MPLELPVITATLDMYGCLCDTVLLQYNNMID
jgi:hypothetical protein